MSLFESGTGKSFIGALLAKVLHDFAKQTILVVCYTNHALDQFLEDLLNIGIPQMNMVRLGGKSTPRTACLALQKQARGEKSNWGKADFREIDDLRGCANRMSDELSRIFEQFKSFKVSNVKIMEHLEFDYPEYFEAFQVPQSTDGMQQIGKGGKVTKPDYLLDRWMQNGNAGYLSGASHVREASDIWNMDKDSRGRHVSRWKDEILKGLVEDISVIANNYNGVQNRIDHKFSEKDAAILRNKRIIGCTTTAAAKYREAIGQARIDVLLVEEAGEILESHILTALGAETKQLILIGDHKFAIFPAPCQSTDDAHIFLQATASKGLKLSAYG
jgi:AAA domain